MFGGLLGVGKLLCLAAVVALVVSPAEFERAMPGWRQTYGPLLLGVAGLSLVGSLFRSVWGFGMAGVWGVSLFVLWQAMVSVPGGKAIPSRNGSFGSFASAFSTGTSQVVRRSRPALQDGSLSESVFYGTGSGSGGGSWLPW